MSRVSDGHLRFMAELDKDHAAKRPDSRVARELLKARDAVAVLRHYAEKNANAFVSCINDPDWKEAASRQWSDATTALAAYDATEEDGG